ncbi:hypothetical protein CDD81_6793 [Ophiocordyceps australis]|uniref:Sequence orphan n=1 Tax=Ophiocordyceps australis TaxID=1399860 RepID=A0A2C5Y1T5_9HYPO|nr:hypothetical protein CDD81_6793 [Ophiocordyceps australis]
MKSPDHNSVALVATPSQLPSPTLMRHSQWNTKNLPSRLAADAASATAAGILIAPIISIIDRSIMENASGRAPSVLASIRCSIRSILSSPPTSSALFSRPTRLILLLYAGTYFTANLVDTCTSTLSGNLPASAVSSGPAKFAASSTANVALCIYKDRAFVRLFGTATAPRPIPWPCYALFTLRDCITIFASFNLPPVLAPRIDDYLHGAKDSATKHANDASKGSAAANERVTSSSFIPSGLVAAQFLAPAAVQFLSTPLHLLGLDLYNRPSSSPADRASRVRANWLVSSLARICRIVPAFGVGGVVNLKLRQTLMVKLE